MDKQATKVWDELIGERADRMQKRTLTLVRLCDNIYSALFFLMILCATSVPRLGSFEEHTACIFAKLHGKGVDV